MTTPSDEFVHVAGGIGAPAAPGGSFLEELRAEFAKPIKVRRHYAQLPAIGGRLHAKYKPLEVKEVLEVQRQDPSLEMAQDFLIRSVVGIYVLDPEHPDADEQGYVALERKADVDVGGPLKFDNRLADLIGIERGTAREVLLRLFDGEGLRLVLHFEQITDWMASTTEEHAEDFAAGS